MHQHLGEARGAHNRADHEQVAPWMVVMIGMVFLVKGDGHLGPPKPHRGGEGVDGVHLLLGDVALPMGFIRLGASKDHEAALSLGKLIIFLLGTVHLLPEGAMDVALHGGIVLEKMLHLTPMEWVGGLERLLEVF